MGVEEAKRLRSIKRRFFTIAYNRLDAIIKQHHDLPIPVTDIVGNVAVLDKAYKHLVDMDEQVRDSILPTASEDDIQKECEEVDEYNMKYHVLKSRAQSIVNDIKPQPHSDNQHKKPTERNYQLPKLEMTRFDGNVKNWLFFWAQFRKVDADENIETSDKLAYLLQAMEPGTEVRRFVQNFPPTDTAYKECIEQLKARYAKDEVLIQVYVRELLSIVLMRNHDSYPLSKLYDSLNLQIRALDTLGVTKDKFAAFLLPMVESALPNELLKVWERTKKGTDNITDELSELLLFLQKEVEAEQRIYLTRQTFDKLNVQVKKDHTTLAQEPTAGCLVSNTNNKEKLCIWCEKQNHNSFECYKLQKMNLEERKETLRKRKACTVCLKKGHIARNCKAHVRCIICGQRHAVILCSGQKESNTQKYDATKQNKGERSKASTDNNDKSSLSAYISTAPKRSPVSITYLQTVSVIISNGEKEIIVRAMFDSGAQRSYIKDEIVSQLGLSPVSSETLTHALFGGVELKSNQYNVYNLKIYNLDKTFSLNLNVLGQKCICRNIPTYTKDITHLLQRHNITLTDNNQCEDVGLLIGADFSGLLFTGSIVNIHEALVAIKTKLGWTLQGRATGMPVTVSSIANILHCSTENELSNFWCLENIGIRDPIEVKSQKEKDEEALQNFEEQVRINEEGRYEVSLPWKVGHDNLSSNYELASRRLESVTKKLKTNNLFKEYDKVFKYWCDQNIIEIVQCPDQDTDCHYLPHRPVIKEKSLTTRIRPVFDASAKDSHSRSLNLCLDKGVNLLVKIPKLLIGFRKRSIGVTADIAKAFLQISVSPTDRDMLRFLWWDENNKLITYRHCRVVFGLTSSPFLLSATIQHHLMQISGVLKKSANILLDSFYVDNCLTSLDTIKDVRKFELEAKLIMDQAKFDLTQWVIAPSDKQVDNVPVLGLVWYTGTDELGCDTSNLPRPEEVGKENCADLLSRGCSADQLLSSRWLEGPTWLYEKPEHWPVSRAVVDEVEASHELKKMAVCNTTSNVQESILNQFSYFSKYSKIIRTVAWMLRFTCNAQNKIKKEGELTYDEFEEAEKRIIRLVQQENKEYIENKINSLTHIYDDKDSLIKIKTKLLLTDVPVNTKLPVVLPAKSFITRRLIEQRHAQLQHAGLGTVMADLRTRFWIIGARQLVKSVINNCNVCKRHRARPTQAPAAPLPIERTQCSAPFEITGVDLAGPLILRGNEKCWIVLYTCAVYRAVHLELTRSLSTEAFLMTLRRFIARRGRIRIMVSDNGTNFVGSKNLLSELDWDEITRQSTIQRIKWKLNAPTAAWWGGFWERLIKILKDLLKRVLGQNAVTYEELQTILCDCESTMNSRPLTYIEDEKMNSLEPLTPSCFLQPIPGSDVIDLDQIDTKSLNLRLNYLQKLRQDFRQRFRSEYLTTLVQRGREKKDCLKVGDVVLVETEEKRLKWPLGIIEDIFTGRDDINRTARVRTSAGFKIRPFQRLYKLEITNSDSEFPQWLKTAKEDSPTIPNTQQNLPHTDCGLQVHGQKDVVKEQVTRSGRVTKMPHRYLI